MKGEKLCCFSYEIALGGEGEKGAIIFCSSGKSVVYFFIIFF